MTIDSPARVSVVICSHTVKRWDQLAAAVGSLSDQTLLPHEIIVVVDHNDALLARAGRLLPGVRVMPNLQVPGASAARNTGVGEAVGDLVAFLDDDAQAAPDWLEQLTKGFSDATVLGVGGSIQPAWQAGRPQWFPQEFDWVVGCTYIGMPERAMKVRNLIAANMVLRRDVFERLGGFRDGFGNTNSVKAGAGALVTSRSGDEETELCIRALDTWPGCSWMYEPEARVTHHVPASRGTRRYFLSRCYDEGLGKARLTRLFGSGNALSSERRYVTSVLAGGVLRRLAAAFTERDLAGLAQAGAIISGLLATATGYLVGTIYLQMAGWKEPRSDSAGRDGRASDA